jgi:hypothetical protein
LLIVGDDTYVLCENGIQIVDAQGEFKGRLPLIQEKTGSREWDMPGTMSVTPSNTILLSFSGGNVVREIDMAGTRLLREIFIPPHPVTKIPASISDAIIGPDGRIWMVSSTQSVVISVAGDANGQLPTAQVEYYGYPFGSAKPYDPATDGDRFLAPSKIRYLPKIKKFAIIQPSQASIALFDPKTKKIVGTIGGMGGALNQFSGISDVQEYDEKSVYVVDPLRTRIVRLKVTADPADETNGDYIESFVDDADKQLLNITSAGSISRARYDAQKKKMFVISSFDDKLMIFTVQ